MSTSLNTVSGTLYEDFISPCLPNKVSEETASFIIKAIVIVVGTLCVVLVAVIEQLGALLEVASSFSGVTQGTSLGIFLLGILFPMANSKGAIVGSVSSLSVMAFIMAGQRYTLVQGFISDQPKSVSVAGCGGNISNSFIAEVGNNPSGDEIIYIFQVSFFYYNLMGCIIVLMVGLLVSYFTRNPVDENINPDVFCPLVQRFVRITRPHTYADVPLQEVLPREVCVNVT